MARLQHLPLPRQAAAGHVAEKVGMSVKYALSHSLIPFRSLPLLYAKGPALARERPREKFSDFPAVFLLTFRLKSCKLFLVVKA